MREQTLREVRDYQTKASMWMGFTEKTAQRETNGQVSSRSTPATLYLLHTVLCLLGCLPRRTGASSKNPNEQQVDNRF